MPAPEVPHLLAGDLNGRNSVWDTQRDDGAAGEALLDWTLENGYAICNDPDVSTRPVSATSPDITMATGLQVTGWRILSGSIASDHVILTYDISWTDGIESLLSDPPWRATLSFTKANWSAFATHSDAKLAKLPLHGTCNQDQLSTALTKAILQAAKKHIPKGRFPHHRALWTGIIEQADSTARAATPGTTPAPKPHWRPCWTCKGCGKKPSKGNSRPDSDKSARKRAPRRREAGTC